MPIRPILPVRSKPQIVLIVTALTAVALAVIPVSSQPAAAYADRAACAQCHPEIAETYARTGMGRSFHKVEPAENLGDGALGKPFYHEPSNTFIDMILRDGTWFQRRWQLGYDGKETNVDEKRVDYVMGSGNHSRTLLHWSKQNTLQELPLGWYAEKGGFWGMNPGYDRADYAGSVRPIFYECMFCHNGYPRVPEGAQRDTAQAKYLEPLAEGIDCQRCHGPGQSHVDKASRGDSAESVRAAIVNPKRLSPERAMEVCLQCHLETSNEKLPHAIVRFDRGPFSYAPGQPLGDFQIAFDRAPGKNTRFEVAKAGYRFLESQCFLKSAGKLTCTSCHNPHDVPRGEQAVAGYNQVCTGCHPAGAPTKAAAAAKPAVPVHQGNSNCVGCHMPRRRTDDAVHVVMTDHFIGRRAPGGDPLAEKQERADSSYKGPVVPYYPAKLAATADNSLTAAVAQVREEANLKAGLPLLAAQIAKYRPTRPEYYTELAEGYLAVNNPLAAIRYFAQASRLEPNSAPRLIQWGDALMQAKQWTLAETKLRRASELAPEDPRAWGRLGWALWQQDKAAEAQAVLEKAIGLDDEIPELHNDLGLILWGVGNRAAAEAEFRAALRIQPGVAEWRLNLGRALASQGELIEARFQLEESLRLRPENVAARIDYARMLADSGRIAEAEKQVQIAVEARPRSPQGHEMWGALLADKGDLAAAKRELAEAVRLQPAFGRARVELAMVLLRLGDRAAAVPHLRAAASGADPEARAAATQILGGLK